MYLVNPNIETIQFANADQYGAGVLVAFGLVGLVIWYFKTERPRVQAYTAQKLVEDELGGELISVEQWTEECVEAAYRESNNFYNVDEDGGI